MALTFSDTIIRFEALPSYDLLSRLLASGGGSAGGISGFRGVPRDEVFRVPSLTARAKAVDPRGINFIVRQGGEAMKW